MNGIKLKTSLFLLRITISILMLLWSIDKFINPAHAEKIFNNFYFIASFGGYKVNFIAIMELLLIGGFVLGISKTITYGSILLFHVITTLSSIDVFFKPFVGSNLLIFFKLPILAGCITLFLLRKDDRLFSF
jgi:putative oxidoreductase